MTLSNATSGVVLRTFLFSMLFAIKPVTAVTALLLSYAVNVVLMKVRPLKHIYVDNIRNLKMVCDYLQYLNREGWACFIDGYASLLTPTGYARVLGTAARYISR